MPIFEYNCAKCGKVSEFLEKSGSNADRKCGHCGSSELIKRFSTFAVGVKEQGGSSKCMTCSDGKCPHAGGMI